MTGGVYKAYRYKPEPVINFDGSLESAKACLEALKAETPIRHGEKKAKYTAVLQDDGTMTIMVQEHLGTQKVFAVAPAVIRLQGEFYRPEAVRQETFDQSWRTCNSA